MLQVSLSWLLNSLLAMLKATRAGRIRDIGDTEVAVEDGISKAVDNDVHESDSSSARLIYTDVHQSASTADLHLWKVAHNMQCPINSMLALFASWKVA